MSLTWVNSAKSILIGPTVGCDFQAILAEDNYQELELHYPRLRLLEAGARVSVIGVSSRTPDDLPAFCRELLRTLSE